MARGRAWGNALGGYKTQPRGANGKFGSKGGGGSKRKGRKGNKRKVKRVTSRVRMNTKVSALQGGVFGAAALGGVHGAAIGAVGGYSAARINNGRVARAARPKKARKKLSRNQKIAVGVGATALVGAAAYGAYNYAGNRGMLSIERGGAQDKFDRRKAVKAYTPHQKTMAKARKKNWNTEAKRVKKHRNKIASIKKSNARADTKRVNKHKRKMASIGRSNSRKALVNSAVNQNSLAKALNKSKANKQLKAQSNTFAQWTVRGANDRVLSQSAKRYRVR